MKFTQGLILLAISLLILGCNKEDDSTEKPQVFASTATLSSQTGVTLSGNFKANGFTIHDVGFKYSPQEDFGFSRTLEATAQADGSFSAQLATGLEKDVEYYFKAFAKSETETFYSGTKSFISTGSVDPQLEGISPETGHIDDTLTLHGNYLKDRDYSTKVYLGTAEARITRLTDTLIKCIVPAELAQRESTVKVKIGDRETTYDAFTLYSPTLTGFTPATAAIRDTVTIVGDHFDTVTGRNQVFFGSTPAQVVETSRTTIKVIVPDAITSSTESIKVISQSQETIFDSPFQLKMPELHFIPSEVNVRQELTIEGAYFHPILQENKITIEGIEVSLLGGDTQHVSTRMPIGPFPRRMAKVTLTMLDMSVTYDIDLTIKDKWVMVKDDLPFRFGRGPKNSVVIDNTAYVIAPEIEYNIEDPEFYLWKFNASDYSWQKVNTTLPEAGFHTSGILQGVGNALYYYAANDTNAFYKYNVLQNTWIKLASFPGPRRDYPSYFTIKDDIYIGLGADIMPYTPIVYRDFYKYNTATGQWSEISQIPFDGLGGYRRTCMASFVINNIAYLAGGATNTGDTDAYSYNPALDRWARIADFPTANHGSNGFAINGVGYVIGGLYVAGSAHPSHSRTYKPHEDKWEQGESIIEGRQWHFAFVLDGKGYIGGALSGHRGRFWV
ncbi:MAG: hypothetical protein CL868_05200 [Cytophagaceae bacterium]|nr:hypothetical protein [Cytophagaceae bacterium]|tara:strand:- start:9196 stop:11205 length:2010 start_codon:yes stop_codon:yes gene_type:complete